jgi:hypothetical protein
MLVRCDPCGAYSANRDLFVVAWRAGLRKAVSSDGAQLRRFGEAQWSIISGRRQWRT